jgi:DNA-directed RNA polymerase specialized sigma24 family protein
MEDHELLGEYVERRSDQAFMALVERHIDLVYSTALRSVRDPHLARDVVQKVFILLARKPGSIRNARGNPVAIAWPWHSTRPKAGVASRKGRKARQAESGGAANSGLGIALACAPQ